MAGPTKLQRWLDLIAFLASRRFPVPVDELWAGVPAYARGVGADERTHASVRRMFERDKDELREIGIPIETVTYSIDYGIEQATGYRLQRRDFHLPYLRLLRETSDDAAPASAAGDTFDLTEGEAAAALDGLRNVAALPGFALSREARSAFRKLAFDLDEQMLGDAPVHYLPDPETTRSSDALRRLSDALLERKTVRFGYHSIGRDAHEERTVRPYGLFFQHGRWYLVGLDEARGEPRVYRVGRMSDVTPNAAAPGTPDYAIPEAFRLERYTGRSAWELGDEGESELEATVRFEFPRSLWAERNGHGRLVEELADGAQTRTFQVHRLDPFLRWVLSLGGDATVQGPAHVRDAFRRMASEVAARHGTRS